MHFYYVYGITSGINEKRINTLSKTISNDNHVDIVENDGIQAIINAVPSEEFDTNVIYENLNNIQWVEEKAFAHDNILKEISDRYSTVPMKFCTIYRTKENLINFMSEHRIHLRNCISLAEENHERNLKVFYDSNKIKQDIVKLEEFKNELALISKKPKGIAFMLKKKFDDRVEKHLEKVVNSDIQEMYRYIKSFCRNIVVKEAADHNSGNLKLALKAALLTEKSNVDLLYEKIVFLVSKYSDKGYEIYISKPLPIYNFVELKQ